MPKRTPLYAEHLKLGARMVPFGGWEMPLHYGSQIEEHNVVRTGAGMFDVSHMLCIDVTHKAAKSFLRHVLANDVQKMKGSGRALYSCMLNENGGVLDDLIVYALGEETYRMVVNAATAESDLAWLQQHAKHWDIELQPRVDLGLLAVQGPKARDNVLMLLNANERAKIQALSPFGCAHIEEGLIARTGYTGEDGFEIMLSGDAINHWWQRLLESHTAPIGLGARDSLRLEAGFNLYGADMDETVTPLESNLGWTVDYSDNERDFIGKAALLSQKAGGVKRHLKGICLEQGICRQGMSVFAKGSDEPLGKITSGGFSPTLSSSIGMVRLTSLDHQDVDILIRGKKQAATIVPLPFYRRQKPKNHQVVK